MPDDSLDQFLQFALDDRRAQHLFRSNQLVTPIDSTHVQIDGRRYVNFCSNNYLGLTHHLAIAAAIERAVRDAGAGAAASPLISGYTAIHQSAERALASWKGTEAAVLLPSGYQANHAAIQALAGAADASGRPIRFLLDKLAHASLIDAVRGGGLPLRVFPHNDLGKLARLLQTSDPNEMQVVVTESIFSMDGDAAPLRELAKLKREKPFVLLLDEAHGSGVYGENGSGYAAECGVTESVDIFVVTLSKSLGVAGGAICSTKAFRDAVVNVGRAYIYSTAIPPMLAAGGDAAIEAMRLEPHRQQRVRMLAAKVRERLAAMSMNIPAGDSPIIPVIFGSEETALQAADDVRKQGILVIAVRPPSVPPGSSRLRITLSADHTDDEIERLLETLERL
jgi:8-amino-7-oxononanoate synthase